jgi:hypothetical protein
VIVIVAGPPALLVLAFAAGMIVTCRFVPVPLMTILFGEEGTRAGLLELTAKVKFDAFTKLSSAIVKASRAGTSSGLITSVNPVMTGRVVIPMDHPLVIAPESDGVSSTI